MSVYSMKGKGWRYDFTLKGERYTQAWFPTKTKAKQAEAETRKEVLAPQKETQTPTDMNFLELVNRKLDDVEARNSFRYYQDFQYMARRWAQLWGELNCRQITREMIEQFVRRRKKQVSARTANKEIRYLRSVFNFGKKKSWLSTSPVDGIDFFPVDKQVRYIPTAEDVEKIILHARSDKWLMARYPDAPDYLETLRDTLGRMSEINRLKWDDVILEERYLILYTRKIDGGLSPRKIPMTQRLDEILSLRYAHRDPKKPWVFWNPRTGLPYRDRKSIMKRLCEKAKVSYFRFHPLRHSSASLMDNSNVPTGAIQRILGHKNRKTTEIYLHSVGEYEREAIEMLEAVREKSLTQIHTQRYDDSPETLDAPVAQPG